jgi:hypothetical protein
MAVSSSIGAKQLPVVHMRINTTIRTVWLVLLTMAGYLPGFANAQSLCESCEVQIGLGEMGW